METKKDEMELVPKSYIAYDTILLPKKISRSENVFTFFEFQEGLSFDDNKRSNENIKDKRYTNMHNAKSFPQPQEFEFYDVSLSIPYFGIEMESVSDIISNLHGVWGGEQMAKAIRVRREGSVFSDIFQLMANSELIIYVGNCPFLTLAWDLFDDCGGDYYYKGVWRGKAPCRIERGVSLFAVLRFGKSFEFSNKIFVKIGLSGVLYAEVR